MSMVSRYQKRISGPLLDRIDIHIEVPRVEYEKLTDERLGEPSVAIQSRVEAARERQRQRFDGSGLMSNADTPALAAQVQVWAPPRCAPSARSMTRGRASSARPCTNFK
jgi:predicted ATPase with chaperone activity